MAKIPLPTVFVNEDQEERIYIAAKHLGIGRTEFCEKAILNALMAHEQKYGGIMTISAKDAIAKQDGLPGDIGKEETDG